MTYIFTAAQFAGFTKKTLGSDDLLVLENVSFLAELLTMVFKKTALEKILKNCLKILHYQPLRLNKSLLLTNLSKVCTTR